ncbi:MAG: efflux RND transporter permease subunit, partial [Planctomycetota bacterium]
MDLIRLAISKPVSVAVGVVMVVMFGLIGVGAIPIQLTPNVDRPIITVTTNWPGRTPEEIVDRITKEQEEVLKNVENLKSMRSVTSDTGVTVTLEFYLGTEIDRARLEVSDALRRVPDYPEDATEPVIQASEGSNENAIAWIMIELPPEAREALGGFDITTLQDDLDREVKPYLERIPGVAQVNIFGGRPREMQVLIDPVALAQRGITYDRLITALRAENRDVAAGAVPEGKRDYRIRVMGKYRSAEDVAATVIAHQNGDPVRVADVARVRLGYDRPRGFVRSVHGPALAMNVIRQNDANVMDLMAELRRRLAQVQRDVLPRIHPDAGPHLRLRQVYDETTYIASSIDLVVQNLWVGGSIAAFVLLLFLRSFIATGVIAVAIPISVIGTFLALLGLGRTLNVVSLAGLAFAVGMVVDNAIVVLENIDRRRSMGESATVAAHRGGREVFGAILASTLTTVAVFVPILTIQEEAGQLFRDISLAIVASVSLSLIVSVTVIPAACAMWLPEHHMMRSRLLRSFQTLFGLAPALARLVDAAGRAMLWTMTGWRGWTIRPALILLLTAASLVGAVKLMPDLDYLPAGNRNLVFGGLLIPPGYSVEQTGSIADRIEDHIRPYVGVGPGDDDRLAALPPI